MIDEVLGRTLGGVRHGIRGLALGANEEHAATLGDRIAHRHQGLVEERHGLGQIHDVDLVAIAEDEGLHLRIPAVCLVAEVDASFQKLTHIEGGKRHGVSAPFPVGPPRMISLRLEPLRARAQATGAPVGRAMQTPPARANPRVRWTGL